MIIKKEKIGNIWTYYVKKNIPDDKMEKLKNTYVKPSQIDLILEDDSDVYTEDNKLLLRFRKGKLSKTKINNFYNNVISFAKQKTSNRGNVTGNNDTLSVSKNPRIMTNILGYFDGFSPSQKLLMKNKIPSITARECNFNIKYPQKYKELLPLIQEIDLYYKKYASKQYNKQLKKANQTYFRINKTSFTTVTTNVNFQTTIHKDVGDDVDGFGNLVVIEKGKYSGGETCLPQFGIAVNVRTADVLFIDVHEWHGNLPIKYEDDNTIRLSIVCYLRKKLWEITKNKTKKFMEKHNKTIKKLTLVR
jgi:hypothetical protein